MEPFNPRCEGWTQGIETFGAKDKMMNKNENNKLHYKIKVRSHAKESELSEKDREQLRADGMERCVHHQLLRDCIFQGKSASVKVERIRKNWARAG
eukprot:scaffold10743_cov58-Attheya_sp.AAC.5